ncbi:MAG TPA: protein kinase [Ktedonobacteraceae bacterium]|nr:protein kinase [Ktedonobacteraceae bacterium]
MGQVRSQNVCGNCGKVNAADEQFCNYCGYNLASGPVIQPSSGARWKTGTLSAGNVLSGRYRITRLAGKGGFGVVYEARDERFQGQRVVAIKEMGDAQMNPQERAQALQALRNEATLLIHLRHPHLPDVSDFFEEGGKAYLVMEFIEGKTLEKAQEDAKQPLDEKLVMTWALQLCDVLNYLHTRPQPIIFRDMKPSNVMLTRDGQIKLIDFGIARVFKSTSARDTTSLGSRGYGPLEQYGRGQTDARSDIYALGATLYDLLTQTTPLDSVTRRVNPSLFQTPRKLNPNISPVVESIVLKAMEQEPKDRYQSATEMSLAILASGVVPTTQNWPGPIQPQLVPRPVQGAAVPTQPAMPLAAASPNMAPPAQQQQVLMPSSSPAAQGTRKPSRLGRRAFIGLLGTAAVGTGLYWWFEGRGQSSTSLPTVTVSLIYSTEKADWLQAALSAFQQQNPRLNGKAIQIEMNELGSLDTQAGIVNDTLRPTAWSPASFLELNLLSTNWQQKYPQKTPIINATGQDIQSLVFSPLVFTLWKSRADVLLQKYGSIDWPTIHTALTLKNGWSDIGGQALSDWGLVKFGQTRPDKSNSGLLTITLMAYAYYQYERSLQVSQIDNAQFLQYFEDIEGAVNAFGRSSGTFLENVVIPLGQAQYDIVTTYENLVLTLQQEAQQHQGELLQMFYPSHNIVSDHPFAILQGSWVTAEQRQAAQMFRDFLLSKPMQQLALTKGFRPTNPDVHITDNIAHNPFRGQSAGTRIMPEIQPLVQAPDGDVVNELLNQWLKRYNSAPLANG